MPWVWSSHSLAILCNIDALLSSVSGRKTIMDPCKHLWWDTAKYCDISNALHWNRNLLNFSSLWASIIKCNRSTARSHRLLLCVTVYVESSVSSSSTAAHAPRSWQPTVQPSSPPTVSCSMARWSIAGCSRLDAFYTWVAAADCSSWPVVGGGVRHNVAHQIHFN